MKQEEKQPMTAAQLSIFQAPAPRRTKPSHPQEMPVEEASNLLNYDISATMTTLRCLLYESDPAPEDTQALDTALEPFLPHACAPSWAVEMVWTYVHAHGWTRNPCFAQSVTGRAVVLMESLWGVAMMVDGMTGFCTEREAHSVQTASIALVEQALGWAGLRVATKSHSWGRFHLGETPHACAWFSLIGQWGVQLDLDECHKVRVRIAPPKVKNRRAYRPGDWSALDVWMLLLKSSRQARLERDQAHRQQAAARAAARKKTMAAYDEARVHLMLAEQAIEFHRMEDYPNPLTWGVRAVFGNRVLRRWIEMEIPARGLVSLLLRSFPDKNNPHISVDRKFIDPTPDLLRRAGEWMRGEATIPQEEPEP